MLRVDVVVCIVTIRVVYNVAAGLRTGGDHVLSRSISIAVVVCIPNGGIGGSFFIGLSITIIIKTVAQLGGARVEKIVVVVAVIGV